MAGKRKRPPRRSRPETRRERINRLIAEGKCGLLPAADSYYPCPCPRKSGPEHPDPAHPGMVWHATCRGCRYFEGSRFTNYVCSHPQARQVSARHLAEAVRRWEEEQAAAKRQPTLF